MRGRGKEKYEEVHINQEKKMETKENAKEEKEGMRQKETTGGRNRKARKKEKKE